MKNRIDARYSATSLNFSIVIRKSAFFCTRSFVSILNFLVAYCGISDQISVDS